MARPIPADLFRKPFGKDSAHHTPLGDGVQYGIPPSTLKALVANPVYIPGQLGTRGRLDVVKTFRTGSTKQGMKYLHLVDPNDREFAVEWHRRGGNGGGLPANGRAPLLAPYGDQKGGDNEVFLFPRGGNPDSDVADVFAEFTWSTTNLATARLCVSYPISGADVRNRFDDPGAWGPGAIDWRHPAGFLRRAECDRSGNTPIRHRLNATATRHSRQGAPPELHVLSRGIAHPAWLTDRPLNAGDNQGDLPYGTIIGVRWQDRGLRDQIGLSPLGIRLFDTFMNFGCCLCDGQGQFIDGGAVLQLRVDHELAMDEGLDAEVDDALQKILPYLWPVFNPRKHNEDAPRHTDGLIYVGGGGPLTRGAVNDAWDAIVVPEPPVVPPEPARIVECPNCGYEHRITLAEFNAAELG